MAGSCRKDDIGMFRHVLRGLKQVGNEFDRSQDISEKYGIHSLPTKILIDREGIIVGRYGEVENLTKKWMKIEGSIRELNIKKMKTIICIVLCLCLSEVYRPGSVKVT